MVSCRGEIVFGTILISAITLLHIYVFWRTASVPLIGQVLPKKILIGIGLLLWVVFLLGRIYGRHRTGPFATVLEFIGMNWMGFLLFVAMLAVDIVTGFGFLLPRISPSLRGWALVAGALLSVVALVQGLRPPVVRSYEVRLPGLPAQLDGLVLVAVSDLHIDSVPGNRWLAARVAQVQAQRPDLVVLLGDIFESRGRPSPEQIAVLRRLSAPFGVWGVLGNHEFHGGGTRSVDVLSQAGIQLLRNRWVQIRPGFILAGVDDLTTLHRSGSGGDPISQALKGRPAGSTILLSHTPWQAEKAAGAGTSLMLSGHTHGGQIWPFGYLVRRVYPLLAGRYQISGMPVIVCRGTGTWGPRMRLWHPGEILRVTLRAKK
jgi:predicted MPP superfamily phosphohydrolase